MEQSAQTLGLLVKLREACGHGTTSADIGLDCKVACNMALDSPFVSSVWLPCHRSKLEGKLKQYPEIGDRPKRVPSNPLGFFYRTPKVPRGTAEWLARVDCAC